MQHDVFITIPLFFIRSEACRYILWVYHKAVLSISKQPTSYENAITSIPVLNHFRSRATSSKFLAVAYDDHGYYALRLPVVETFMLVFHDLTALNYTTAYHSCT